MMEFSNPFWLLFAIPVGLLWWLWRTRRRSLNIWRAALLVVLFLAIADLSIRWPRPGGMVVVLADRSASLPDHAEQAQREVIARLQREMKPEHRLTVISIGERAEVEQSPQQGAFNGFTLQVGEDQSRLADGMELALGLVPAGTPGRLLVLGDGHWTGRDPLEPAQRAALRNIPMDYRLLQREILQDLSIHSVSAPQAVAQGQSFFVHTWVESPMDQEIEYTLMRNGQKIAGGRKALTQGINKMIFRDRLESAGAAAYRLTISGSEEDPLPQNNRARFMVGVEGELPVLCLTRTPGGAFGRLLSGAGMRVETRDPTTFEWSLENLTHYSGIVLENVSGNEIGSRGMELLAAWVEASGRGLLVTGGKRAYGAGGYFQSPLERILPVSMELRREHRKLSLAIAVVLDRSGSMAASVAGGKTKMDLANIGTVQVLDLLSDMDELGVLAVDSKPHTILDIKPVDECRARREDILQIESMGGGIYVYEGLLEASKMLAGSQAGTRHIILFADAADAEQPGKYKELLENNRLANITVSVVALGRETDSDAEFLRDVAKRGEGDLYFTEDATDVPRIFAQDTFAVARSTFLEEPVGMEWTALMSLLSGGRAFPDAPPLGGYNLCYLREGAQMLAVSKDEYTAPLAAGWQAGAGRVLCYAGEVDGEFTGAISRWPEYGAFLAGMARWTAGKHTPLPDGILLTQEVRKGICRVSLQLDPARKETLFSGEPQVTVLRGIPGQSPQTTTQEMRWRSANLLEVELPLNGTETMVASVTIDGFSPVTMPPACLKYSPEYATKEPGSGRIALERLATVGGGKERIDVSSIWKELPSPWRWISLRPTLLLLAVLLFILEIIERRVGLLRIGKIKRTASSVTPMKARRTKKAPIPKPSSPAPSAPPKPAPPTDGEDTAAALKAARARAQNRFRR
jgi:uncharacterized membrane protein